MDVLSVSGEKKFILIAKTKFFLKNGNRFSRKVLRLNMIGYLLHNVSHWHAFVENSQFSLRGVHYKEYNRNGKPLSRKTDPSDHNFSSSLEKNVLKIFCTFS